MNNSDKLCLQWNDFKENISASFGDFRTDRDLTDVTLACEDGKQVEAHKVILAASSPFFMNLLKKNKHSHPLIYMKGLKSNDLMAIVDFLYLGEVNVFQDNLDSFLALAEELQLKGLTSGNTKQEETSGHSAMKKEVSNKKENPVKSDTDLNSSVDDQNLIDQLDQANEYNTTVAVNSDQEDLDSQIRSMITKSDVSTGNGKLATCNICGKEGNYQAVSRHIEANHISGVSHTCEICGFESRSSNGLRQHKIKNHKDNIFVLGPELL